MTRVQSFEQSLKIKAKVAKMVWNEIDWLLVFSQKGCQSIIKLIEVYLWKGFENALT